MRETVAHSSAWGIAAIMIVVISWFFYHHFAPKSWREWAASGLVQAFIISLYTEMYGFPLTIYLLVRFFGQYAFLRHPQYTGLLLCLFGEGVVHWPTIFSVALLPVIALAYGWLARNEEKRMLEHFGEKFRAYRRRVPMFIPRWGQWREFASSRGAAGD